MVHPALLRTSAPPAYKASRPSMHGGFRTLPRYTERWLRRLNLWVASNYRPEQHYMRGGRTAGAKSLPAG